MCFILSDVNVELSTLAWGRGLACSSHVAVQHSPTLETNQCHAIAERKWQENRWWALIKRANGLRAITPDFPVNIELPFQHSGMQFSLVAWVKNIVQAVTWHWCIKLNRLAKGIIPAQYVACILLMWDHIDCNVDTTVMWGGNDPWWHWLKMPFSCNLQSSVF